MPNVAVPMDGGTRWLTEEERARIALKYGPPHKWTDPNPRPGIVTTSSSYDVRELDREAHRREVDEHTARVTEERARERATRDRRRFLPRLTESVARGIEQALLHRADPTRYPATAAAARWLDHCPLVELAESWLTMASHPHPRGRGRHGLAMALLVRGQSVPTWAPAVRQSPRATCRRCSITWRTYFTSMPTPRRRARSRRGPASWRCLTFAPPSS
jgi:hypothetical protein